MMKRGQFTFYRSFYESVKCLEPQDRLQALETIIGYALDGTVPKRLSPSSSMIYILLKPTLDTARKKAEAGSLGGSKKKATGDQDARTAEAMLEEFEM